MFRCNAPRVADDRDSRIVKKRLENYPEGYPRISAYVDSDVDTVLFRRFGNLHARSLLHKQVELTELEAQLDKLDKDDDVRGNGWLLREPLLEGRARNDIRKALMENIDKKMEAYDKLLLRDANIRRLRRPSKRVHQNYMDFIYTEQPFSEHFMRFIYYKDDFVLLEDLEDECCLDDAMHNSFSFTKFLRPIVASSDDRTKTTDPNIVYYSNERLATLIKILISFASTTLLLAPTFLFLSFDLSIAWMALITSAFAFIFSAAASMLTNANRQGVFAATAAYCAVLVVVISVVQQGRSFQPPLADRECYFPMVENLKPMLVSLKHLWPNSTSSYVFFTLFCIVSIMFCICFALFCMFFYLYTRKTRGIPGQPERLQ